jgi:N-acetylmuramoyl-L-alanine amidase
LTLPLPYIDGSALRFPETFVTGVRNTFSHYVEEDLSRFRIGAIIIDPGHGGRDPGAVGEHIINGSTLRLLEKDINLNVSRQVHSLLTASFPERRILLTRESDTALSLEQRVDMANSAPLAGNEVAIYISIHANFSFNRNARGYEVFYLSPDHRREVIDISKFADSEEIIPILNTMMEEALTIESILLATHILRNFDNTVGHLSPSRGLKTDRFFIVRNTRMPAVLVELGFLSNETEALLLNDDAYLKKLSEAIYKGIRDFISFFERSGGLGSFQ